LQESLSILPRAIVRIQVQHAGPPGQGSGSAPTIDCRNTKCICNQIRRRRAFEHAAISSTIEGCRFADLKNTNVDLRVSLTRIICQFSTDLALENLWGPRPKMHATMSIPRREGCPHPLLAAASSWLFDRHRSLFKLPETRFHPHLECPG
jgi:hypothetical protein